MSAGRLLSLRRKESGRFRRSGIISGGSGLFPARKLRSATGTTFAAKTIMPPSTSISTATNSLPLFDWLDERAAGVLLHPTSFPGEQGVGTFDGAVDRFLDFLQQAGIRYWQLCPLGPTGYGDSPYQCFSAFAGNPYLIDLRVLVQHGLLSADLLQPLARLRAERVDYGALYQHKWPALRAAYETYRRQKPALPYGDFAAFQGEHASWLEGYAYFRALKDHHQGKPWWEWPEELRSLQAARTSPLRKKLAVEVEAQAFYQYLFFGQWRRVRAAALQRGVRIIGDIPIFVALDSADVWSEPRLFELDAKTSRPVAVAGVPPDYFSADGQLWGNPLYRWDVHATENYAWWMDRMRASFSLYDVVRIDHFRGFDEYWRIPAPAQTARQGQWVKGPGLGFFRALKSTFPQARIIAEDLGELTPTVIQLRKETGLPGMTIFQFAFGGGSDNLYLPHNLTQNSVVYPGTHDNDTTIGWYATAAEKERDLVRRYLRVGGAEIGWDFIRASYAAVSRLAVIPMQDVFSLGSEARLNTPGKPDGNWQWRYRAPDLEKLFEGTGRYLLQLKELYGR